MRDDMTTSPAESGEGLTEKQKLWAADPDLSFQRLLNSLRPPRPPWCTPEEWDELCLRDEMERERESRREMERQYMDRVDRKRR